MEKLHRVCEFSQSKWLVVYIEKNTIMRKQAENDFEIKIFQANEQRLFRKNDGESAQAK